MKTATPEQIERRRKMRSLASEISSMSAEQRTALAARLPGIATVEGRALSVFNACLIASQNPQSTIVGGFRQWIKVGRAVRKGEHGMCIWIPTRQSANGDEHASEDDTAETHFFLGTVFDVSQTQEIAMQADEAQPNNVSLQHQVERHYDDKRKAREERQPARTAETAYYSDEFTPSV